MIKFGSIEQFRNAIRNVSERARYSGRDETGAVIYNNAALPTIEYRGTVKMHGTNCSVRYNLASKQITYQSRERVLSLTSDNAGFMMYMKAREEKLRQMFSDILIGVDTNDLTDIVIYGEWCGKGIQKGVAVSEVDKMWVIFAVKVCRSEDKNEWLDIANLSLESEEDRIFSVLRFGQHTILINFNRPELVQEEILKLVDQVEQECPVGKHFGVSGVGEGLVWMPVTEGWRSFDFGFKTKGEKHSISKVKTLVAVDVEKLNTAHEFVASVLTEARLEQGLDNLVREQQKPFAMQSLGDFLRWVVNDVQKEEEDTIVQNQLDVKFINSALAKNAREWFIARFNETRAI